MGGSDAGVGVMSKVAAAPVVARKPAKHGNQTIPGHASELVLEAEPEYELEVGPKSAMALHAA